MWQRDFGQCGFRSLDIDKYSFTRYCIFSIKRPRLLFQILPIESNVFFFSKGATFLCKKKFAIFFFSRLHCVNHLGQSQSRGRNLFHRSAIVIHQSPPPPVFVDMTIQHFLSFPLFFCQFFSFLSHFYTLVRWDKLEPLHFHNEVSLNFKKISPVFLTLLLFCRIIHCVAVKVKLNTNQLFQTDYPDKKM